MFSLKSPTHPLPSRVVPTFTEKTETIKRGAPFAYPQIYKPIVSTFPVAITKNIPFLIKIQDHNICFGATLLIFSRISLLHSSSPLHHQCLPIYWTILISRKALYLFATFNQQTKDFPWQFSITVKILQKNHLHQRFPDQQHQFHLGIYRKWKFSGTTPELQNEKLWTRSNNLYFIKPSTLVWYILQFENH